MHMQHVDIKIIEITKKTEGDSQDLVLVLFYGVYIYSYIIIFSFGCPQIIIVRMPL